MTTNEILIPIPGRLHSVATEGHVTGADEVYDDNLQETQENLNSVFYNFRSCNVMLAMKNNYNPAFVPDGSADINLSDAVGVAIIEGGKIVIVAKDSSQCKWSDPNAPGGNTPVGKEGAIADMNGRQNTATIFSTLGANAPAANYCLNYYPSNVQQNDANFGKGRWWLPSCGEISMIWSHVLEVNRLLSKIGGTPIEVNAGWLWTSSEYSSSYVFTLNLYHGYFYDSNRSNNYIARPVTSFY